MKAFVSLVVASLLAVSLSGCTPPMPPEVRVALEEQSYQCVDGDTAVQFPASIADIAPDFATALSDSCTGMSISSPSDPAAAQIEISDSGTFQCQPFLTVPFAVDAAVIAVNDENIGSLNLDFRAAAAIFDGTITAWNDPALAALNPDVELPATEISVFPAVQAQALASFQGWAKANGVTFAGKLLKASSSVSVKDVESLVAGQIALLPYSINTQAAYLTANIVPDAKHTVAQTIADSSGIASAGTQWVAKASASTVSLTLNAKLKPTPPEGSDVAPLPYQAIYPALMALCGDDNLTTRATARFLLRQDSQGSLGASNLLPLPEAIRIASIQPVAKGLPKVKISEPAQ